MPYRLPPQCHCGNTCTWEHDVHHVLKRISCRKAIAGLTWRAHCFHDPFIKSISSRNFIVSCLISQNYQYYIYVCSKIYENIKAPQHIHRQGLKIKLDIVGV